jgi:hypothetical protein
MRLLHWIFRFAFGCHHSQRSRVLTIKKRTYQICLECGQEFGYSWELMHALPSSVTDSSYEPLNSARHAEAPVI